MSDIVERLRSYPTHKPEVVVLTVELNEAITEIERLRRQVNSNARKGVTAWNIEPLEENGDDFFVLTFHHGLGKTTRLDLWPEEVRELAHYLEVNGRD